MREVKWMFSLADVSCVECHTCVQPCHVVFHQIATFAKLPTLFCAQNPLQIEGKQARRQCIEIGESIPTTSKNVHEHGGVHVFTCNDALQYVYVVFSALHLWGFFFFANKRVEMIRFYDFTEKKKSIHWQWCLCTTATAAAPSLIKRWKCCIAVAVVQTIIACRNVQVHSADTTDFEGLHPIVVAL